MFRALKTLSTIFCFGFAAVIANAPDAHAQSARAKPATPPSASRAAQQIIAMTNRERAQRGLKSLSVDGRCVSAISGHVADMAKGGFLSHSGSDGRGPNERYRKYAPSSLGSGENLAYNTHGTGESFMRQWMNSSVHRANILNPRYRAIGVAIRANCTSAGKGSRKCTYYAGQCFSL
jgi:uncharacterized protein YkwD